jgi:hypothetical protein
VQVQPQVLPENQPTQILVSAKDSVTNAPVRANVFIDGKYVGETNIPFNHSFKVDHINQKIWDPELKGLVTRHKIVIHEATGRVMAGGYNDADIHFPGRTIPVEE